MFYHVLIFAAGFIIGAAWFYVLGHRRGMKLAMETMREVALRLSIDMQAAKERTESENAGIYVPDRHRHRKGTGGGEEEA